MRLNVLTFLFTLAAVFHTLMPPQAEAASALFRMKRLWWGYTPATNQSPYPYISADYHPRLRGPNKAPPAVATAGTTTISGRPAQRFTAPSKFIVDYTFYRACVPGTCRPGYPESKVWYSYWNLKGSFRPNNSQYGGASGPTTVIFPTTMGNPTPPLNQGNPVTPTTTPCIGDGTLGGGCGYFPYDLGSHMAGDRISFAAGNYDKSRAGSIMITPGANRFGGTMHFFYGANMHYYQRITANYPYISKAYGPQMDVRDPNGNTELGSVHYGGPFNVYRMTTYGNYRTTTGTPSSPGGYYSRRSVFFYTVNPFTTGMVTAWEPFGSIDTVFTITGYDNRTPKGLSGVVSMVRPRLAHVYQIPRDPRDPIVMPNATASAWQMDFHFLPEPGASVMMAVGVVVLAALYCRRRHSVKP